MSSVLSEFFFVVYSWETFKQPWLRFGSTFYVCILSSSVLESFLRRRLQSFQFQNIILNFARHIFTEKVYIRSMIYRKLKVIFKIAIFFSDVKLRQKGEKNTDDARRPSNFNHCNFLPQVYLIITLNESKLLEFRTNSVPATNMEIWLIQ